MTAWWNELSGTLQLFWGIALIASLLLLIQFTMSFLGGDTDADLDGAEVDVDGFDADFTVFSIRSILAFFTFFGWGGTLTLQEGATIWFALIVAVVAGFIAMFIVAYLMFWFAKMTESGTFDPSTILLSQGEVYLPIPESRSGKGKVHVIIGKGMKEMDAMTDASSLPTGSKIRVIQVLDPNTLLVEAIGS
ncbi:MAG: hypothetical protein R2769_08455 [Saprospiraceae bacterium]|jgi:hypothetical protein